MKLSPRRELGALAAALMMAAVPAFADEPAPKQVDTAKQVLVMVGLKASIDAIVPAMAGQLQAQLVQIHPEMATALHETLVALLPEWEKDEDAVFTDTAKALAGRLTQAELDQTLAFFETVAGKKYTMAQAPVLDALGASGAAWRQKLTTTMLDRTREEMKKKGFNF